MSPSLYILPAHFRKSSVLNNQNDSKQEQLTSSEIDERSSAALSCLEHGKNSEALTLLNSILTPHPTHGLSLWNRSIVLLRMGNMDAALSDLYLLLREQPKNLEVRNQIRFIHRKLIGNWHFDMMNDDVRNAAYLHAIERAVTPDSIVFEIGTGSGLLSLMAARAGAKHVYTCEKEMSIRNAARKIISKNGFADKITVLDKWSTAVKIPTDIPEKVDIIMGEVFGPGLLEEQGIHFLNDAKIHLLKPGGKILPERATMSAALFEGEDIAKRAVVGTVCGFDLSLFNGLHDDPAIQISLAQHTHRFLSAPFQLRTVEFGVEDLQPPEAQIVIRAEHSGMCHGVAQWFRLETDATHFIDTSPTQPRTHWDQQLQIFEKPFRVEKGQEITFLLRQFSDRFSLHLPRSSADKP